ncbi:hypothetical protein KIH74_24420 [Kineosporia sp. J2-2]|uniref:Uncharacterized protein n=1 Tax=Kineosporia corallincola TaxID=2835133 RepID=A0ABS5TLY3_9ACTN|nr:hypothetical protein [Kineosporia corallincola]MBT0772111.1 hypothetical protein [Kineosporia corallincola]
MNAVFGALLAIGASGLYAENLLSSNYAMLWLPSLMLVVGLAMLLRNRRDDELDGLGTAGLSDCSTCNGAGTVYTAEWNDWRRSGPITSIRELCPSCEGTC